MKKKETINILNEIGFIEGWKAKASIDGIQFVSRDKEKKLILDFFFRDGEVGDSYMLDVYFYKVEKLLQVYYGNESNSGFTCQRYPKLPKEIWKSLVVPGLLADRDACEKWLEKLRVFYNEHIEPFVRKIPTIKEVYLMMETISFADLSNFLVHPVELRRLIIKALVGAPDYEKYYEAIAPSFEYSKEEHLIGQTEWSTNARDIRISRNVPKLKKVCDIEHAKAVKNIKLEHYPIGKHVYSAEEKARIYFENRKKYLEKMINIYGPRVQFGEKEIARLKQQLIEDKGNTKLQEKLEAYISYYQIDSREFNRFTKELKEHLG